MAGSQEDMQEEILFTRELPLIGRELLEDTLCVLANKNDETVRQPEEFQDHLSQGKTIEFIFQTCRKWRLPVPVQFLSVEYLDRFLVKHVRDLRLEIAASNGPRVAWESVVERLSEQVVLRALSCIQIASKKISNCKSVALRDVHGLLRMSGHAYSMHSVLQSELRVMRTLDYKLHINGPLDFVELLLDVVSFNDATFRLQEVYPIAVRLLQGFYLVREDVYARAGCLLQYHQLQCNEDQARMAVRTFKSDKLLLASAILVSAVRLIFPTKYQQFLDHVVAVTRLSPKEVGDFTTVILSVLFHEDPAAP